jgi:hypothetical protein
MSERPSTSRGPSDGTSLLTLPTGLQSPSHGSLRSVKQPLALPELGILSEETKHLAMLGFVDTKPENNIYMREDFCGACGIQHPNYKLLDTYSLCESCLNCLRDHSVLRKRFEGIAPECPLEILFATYGMYNFNLSIVITTTLLLGDTMDCRLAYIVTEEVQGLVNEYSQKDRLILRENQKFHLIFDGDPSPGKPKQLRIRYRMGTSHGCLSLDVMANNQIPAPVLLLVPPERNITILRGAYGHPKGRTTTGRMSYDVRPSHHSFLLSLSSYYPIPSLIHMCTVMNSIDLY